jgi:hypothetical protein
VENMPLDSNQLKAVRAVENALNKAGNAGLAGGVYDGPFILFPEALDRYQVVEEKLLKIAHLKT